VSVVGHHDDAYNRTRRQPDYRIRVLERQVGRNRLEIKIMDIAGLSLVGWPE
jgi:hypothetical protein